MLELKGMGVAMVTPFNASGKIDYSGLEKLTKHLMAAADFLVVQGTTGESTTLSQEEQFSVLEYILEINKGKLPVVYGLGGNNTALVAEKMREFEFEGISAFLSVSPAYNKPTQEGIYRHYKMLNEHSPLPIIVYNVPGRTGSNILPSTIARLAKECDNIQGIKEAAGNIEQSMELMRLCPDDFLMLSGDDSLVLPFMACGGHGIISVIGNAYPKEFTALVKFAAENNFAEARKINNQLMEAIRHIFMEGNPGGIKELLKHLGICESHLRLPLAPVSEDLSKKLYRLAAEM